MSEESATIKIPSRFCGPSTSGNGGYVCGIMGRHLKQPAKVKLKAPPPLETELFFEAQGGTRATLRGPVQLIAEAESTSLDLTAPPPVSLDQAQAASAHYGGLKDHPYPQCFVCGPQRPGGDGLRIFPGPLPEGRGVAAPFIPDSGLATRNDVIDEEFLWAALDCPGAWALFNEGAKGLILGTLCAEIRGNLHPEEQAVVMAWPLGREGRRLRVGSALYSEQGQLVGLAQGTWVELTAEQLREFQRPRP